MSKAKQRGTAFETAVVDYLTDYLDAEKGSIHRITLHGAKDIGDVGGIKSHGKPVVIECKNYGNRDRLGEWLKEAEVERGNADALAGVVISKRRGYGIKQMGGQIVSMTLADFAAIIGGMRNE